MKKGKNIIGAGLFTAIASSLCCITPVLALLSGTTGIAASFSWLEPFRPFLIGITILVLGFAWYQKLQPKKAIDCDCEEDEKPSFLQSKNFLLTVTLFAIVMTAFPYYSDVFYPKIESNNKVISEQIVFKTIKISIDGMTCESCEKHINHTVNQVDGVLKVATSYNNKNAEIVFDISKTNIKEIEKAVNSTGYKVLEIQ